MRFLALVPNFRSPSLKALSLNCRKASLHLSTFLLTPLFAGTFFLNHVVQDFLKPVLICTQNCSSLFVVLSPQKDCELQEGRVGLSHNQAGLRKLTFHIHSLVTIYSSCQESNVSGG